MKCHYIYTSEGEKVLIPGCMGTAAMGIEHCTCRDVMSHAEFERARYNETLKALRAEIKDLEHENAYLNRIIRELTKCGIKKPPAPLPPEPEEDGEEWETLDYCKKGKVLKINGKKS